MMTEDQPVATHTRKRGVAPLTRRRLKAIRMIATDRFTEGLQRHTERFALTDAKGLPRIRAGTQPVIDVCRTQRETGATPKVGQRMEKRD
jgi:hypothetical protein